jgi:hypothetical protein
MRSVGTPGGREPVIFYTHAHGWYLSVRSPAYWRWPWRYRIRLGWDSRRRFRLAGYLQARRVRPGKWKGRTTLAERRARFELWLEDSFPGRAWFGVRRAAAYEGGLRRRRVFGYYFHCGRYDCWMPDE